MTTLFDPNAAATENSGIFGLNNTPDNAKIVIIPVPWEATTSYGGGTSRAPNAVLKASKQVDLYDSELGNIYQHGIAMLPIDSEISAWNQLALSNPSDKALINKLCTQLNQRIYQQTDYHLKKNKFVALLGGDHGCVFGNVKATLEHYPKMGILQIDAHADLRRAYEGLNDSHASIMYNICERLPLTCLVQVGIRDFCEQEFEYISMHKQTITTFFDSTLSSRRAHGESWDSMCQEIVSTLPKEVYISFDIDGLDPRYCPNTGTPVPGGLDYSEVMHLFRVVTQSKRRIVGFDLNEVAPQNLELSKKPNSYTQEWDANVAARIIYKLCGWAIRSEIAN